MDNRVVENNCEMLFECIRSILYDDDSKGVEIEALEPEFRKLGQGIAYTQHLLNEMMQYSADISLGNLDSAQPSRDNLLCSNLKNLQSNLKHLTWQAKQVAKGDYSQHVSYLGEFSTSFNEMIRQLKEREDALNRRAAHMEEYNRFFMQVSSERDELIFIIEEETRDVIYSNREIEQGFLDYLLELPDSDELHQAEVQDEAGRYHEVSAFHIEWGDKTAVSYIVKDITDEKMYSDNLTQIAYNDALTGVKNRQYFDAYVRMFNKEESWDTFSFIDLDGLKYVNDYYGHEEGDNYLCSFCSTILSSFREGDVFIRMGGDEFCLFCNNISQHVLENKFERIRESFIAENTKPYEVSFSYGIVINDGADVPFEDIISLADERMYQYKKAHKKERRV